MDTAKLLLGEGKGLTDFIARLLDDIANLKAMLHAISIGALPLAGLHIDALHVMAIRYSRGAHVSSGKGSGCCCTAVVLEGMMMYTRCLP